MILKHYINAEILRTSAAILMVLVLLFISTRFINYIQYAVDGRISSSAAFELMALKVPGITGFLLPLSFFIAIVVTLGRLYAENEMAVIQSVGVSEKQLANNILPIALGLAIVSGLLSFWISPWANLASSELMAIEQAKAKIGGFSAGAFKQNRERSGVAFVEAKTEAGEIKNLFSVRGINQPDSPLEIQLAAGGTVRSGEQIELIEGTPQDDFLVLTDGANYRFDKQTQQWRKTEYKSYYMRIEPEKDIAVDISETSTPSLALFSIGSAEAIAEIHWRLSAPISILILCFMAVPLTKTQPRKGKFARLFPAIMIYMVYALLLLNGRELIENGKVPAALGFWWIHGLAIGFCLYSFRRTARRNFSNRSKGAKA